MSKCLRPEQGSRATRRRRRHPDGSSSIFRLQVTRKIPARDPGPPLQLSVERLPSAQRGCLCTEARAGPTHPKTSGTQAADHRGAAGRQRALAGERTGLARFLLRPGTGVPTPLRERPSPRASCLLSDTITSEKPPCEHVSRPPRRLYLCSLRNFPQWHRMRGGRL